MMHRSSPTIVVLDGHTLDSDGDVTWNEISSLGKLVVYPRTRPEEVWGRVREADIVLTNKTPVDASVITRSEHLKFIAVLATGYNVVDVQAARAKSIPVANVPTYGTNTVAQHTIALLLELCHHVGLHAQSVRDGEWSRSPDFCYWKKPLIELEGKAMGIVGRGRIGCRVGELAQALGMRVKYASSSMPEGSEVLVSHDEVFASSDVVSMHCALTKTSVGMVNARRLAMMKQGAFVLNTGRGALIDQKALFDALQSGHLGGAALDVLGQEPPPEDCLLLRAKNCVITPHMAWTGLQARSKLMETTVGNIRGFIDGKPVNVINL